MTRGISNPVKNYYASIQQACDPRIWSQGVQLARSNAVIEDSRTNAEIKLKVKLAQTPISPMVTLWPKDEDWYCDCNEKADPCSHIAAAAIALKSDTVQKPESSSAPSEASSVRYRFKKQGRELSLDRFLISDGKETLLRHSLVRLVSGIQSGRLSEKKIATSKADFAIEVALGKTLGREIDRDCMGKLLTQMNALPNVYFENQLIEVSERPVVPHIQVTKEGKGFRLSLLNTHEKAKIFSNGALLENGLLRPIRYLNLDTEDKKLLLGKGTLFEGAEIGKLVSEIIPRLQKRVDVDIKTKTLPEIVEIEPRIVLDTKKISPEKMVVTPKIVYGDPAIAEVKDGHLHSYSKKESPHRNLEKEALLGEQLKEKLFLELNQPKVLEGEACPRFLSRSHEWSATGEGLKHFESKSDLTPELQIDQKTGKGRFFFKSQSEEHSIDAQSVYEAWENDDEFVQVPGLGWTQLPLDWLSRWGDRIEALVSARAGKGKEVPTYLLPGLSQSLDEFGQADFSKTLTKKLKSFQSKPKKAVPKDVQADLRHYQKEGVSWLAFLQSIGVGALLADDMGLGKTLQTICTFRGKCLVISPTSVLYGWEQQIKNFRPQLTTHVFHGTSRKFNSDVDVTLTTYGILRQDLELLSSKEWDVIVIDEAQTIKNPHSRVAQAAHALDAEFKVALSGTPIENRLTDMWSIFHFLNPGLLGQFTKFESEYTEKNPERLKKYVAPFVLRRTKNEVLKELPPKTEVTLHCELSEEERDLYHSLLASCRSEVVETLEKGGSVFAVLELLLRLRQTCCHGSLVPGSEFKGKSSKLKLLYETLDQSIEENHRSLVFSQWTSFLDLIESDLKKKSISYLRLDGSTRNRQEIVDAFQEEGGPPVLLMSLKAGGVGLTLTQADHVFIMDPWWNPAAENQAADRAHRIGQDRPVNVHRIVAKDTVEERILKLQEKKKKLASAVLDGADQSTSITKQDLMDLLK